MESLWSIDQYFEFVLLLLLSTGLSFQVRRGYAWPRHSVFVSVCQDASDSVPFVWDVQVPVVQLLLGQLGLVTSQQMLALWRYVVVGAVAAAAVLTPSTDPFTQMLLAGPLIGLYIGGAVAVRAIEGARSP